MYELKTVRAINGATKLKAMISPAGCIYLKANVAECARDKEEWVTILSTSTDENEVQELADALTEMAEQILLHAEDFRKVRDHRKRIAAERWYDQMWQEA